MPIPCVDTVIVCRGKFLLGRRANKPARGEWFTIGGRVLKGELLERAALRHVRGETGAKSPRIKKLLTTKETIFKNSEQGPSSHTINSVFLVEVAPFDIVPKNSENSELKWFSKIDPRWHPYVREVLRLAGFRL